MQGSWRVLALPLARYPFARTYIKFNKVLHAKVMQGISRMPCMPLRAALHQGHRHLAQSNGSSMSRVRPPTQRITCITVCYGHNNCSVRKCVCCFFCPLFSFDASCVLFLPSARRLCTFVSLSLFCFSVRYSPVSHLFACFVFGARRSCTFVSCVLSFVVSTPFSKHTLMGKLMATVSGARSWAGAYYRKPI
jgi:hypothetical protein